MNKLKLITFAILCGFAPAKWVKADTGIKKIHERYIDFDNIKQSGPMAIMRQVWEIINFLEPGEDGVLSIKTLSEYDCQNRKVRVLKEQMFAEPSVKGKELIPAYSNQIASQWSVIMPNSANETIINIVCPGGVDS